MAAAAAQMSSSLCYYSSARWEISNFGLECIENCFLSSSPAKIRYWFFSLDSETILSEKQCVEIKTSLNQSNGADVWLDGWPWLALLRLLASKIATGKGLLEGGPEVKIRWM